MRSNHPPYLPPKYNFNRFCHRLVGLLRPEARVNIYPRITIPQIVIVPDTSTYEGRINPAVMLQAGAQGVIAKATQCQFKDDQFDNTWSSARGTLPRGSYHFYDPTCSPTAQVNEYAAALGNDPGELPLVVDWEATWTGPWSGWSNLYAFLEGIKARYPNHPIMIYTGYYYWLDHSPNPITQPASLAYFGQYALWLAWYSSASVVKVPAPWTDLKFWQFTDSGPGATYGTQSGAVDLSYYNGTHDQFNAEYGVVTPVPPPPTPPPGGMMTQGIAKAVTNIKPMTTGQVPALTSLAVGQAVYGTLVGAAATGDLINIDAVFSDGTPTATKIPLGVLCKVYSGNLTLNNNVPEPVPPVAVPVVTTQPVDQTVVFGQAVTFSAAATGADSVKWQVSSDGGITWADIVGATSPSLTFTPAIAANGRLYRAVFTNSGGSVFTNGAQLTVSSPAPIKFAAVTYTDDNGVVHKPASINPITGDITFG